MIRTILFFVYFWLSVLFVTPLGFVLLVLDWLQLQFLTRPLISLVARWWAKSIILASGTKTVVRGLENIPQDKALVFVSNHQGDMDFVMMLAYLPRTVGFIIKSQALFLPFINIWIAALGSVFLNRDSLAKGKRSIDIGARKIKNGRALCIYPEGTRSRGSQLGSFRKGSFKLATLSGASIVPVTVNGSWLTWEAHKRIESATIEFTVHPPIPTAGLEADARRALPERVREAILSALPPQAQPQTPAVSAAPVALAPSALD
ncbi:MAG: hypothetical protein A2087_04790 [Spirochaetes bacterium GWD1_61_31]|nr:MAG: hypothetical protein A2Y37_01670 [Spirochaetes bacterium GWB1_60_80]OHD34922.1 MAG: hypothetical protein A2004_00700 [Spirochaetes bacterium GWC1_61_12]OHD37049.1 MAG: hypothetical protein A2087_04790 [Spirochaetes bacterium GWD1_61_31]OHD45341.1 MAG: hypothetical protein A2Y35_00600 [Spirochaetes bacterium GWE1_60_18]OHD61093.1 MAG: hypothetical protein A2Y32_09285 [Spirochaetes bacterium GWF1_60_12]HAP42755.1 1-acyl-sn-glycerol-3-phosphate acyltransferase [Spirochaetaceae bacterium]